MDDELTLKKKKKKKICPDWSDAESDDTTVGSSEPALDLTLTGKKKKKKTAVLVEQSATLDHNDKATTADASDDRLPTYEELLTRAYQNIKVVEKQRFTLHPPQIVRCGSKKTAFVNFIEICRTVHRPVDHMRDFIQAELCTTSSIDGSNTLILRGVFQQAHMESVVRHYAKEYVLCHTCKSSNTLMRREDRMMRLTCESCSSGCVVAEIRSGFQAVVRKQRE
jgi:translation initiation factor 2 subunit 2